ncbi:MAG: RND superfamily exporter [Acetothermia bacterium 64_32]|nr:MAG: RND superfamily exporter [Acetothermia bacterium 64_32]MBC7098557.1 MMPL family transporter [Candidatus Bipolaricaulota bacterium]
MTSRSAPQPERKLPKAKRLRTLLLDGIARLSRRQAVGVVLVVAVLVGFSLFYIRELPIRSSYLDLLPEEDPLIEKYKAREGELTATDYAAILLSLVSPPEDVEERRERLFSAADRLIQLLLEEPEFKRASYRIGEAIEYPKELLLYQTLSPEDLEGLKAAAEELLAAVAEILPESGKLSSGLAELEEALTATGDPSAERIIPLVDRLLQLGASGLEVLRGLPRVQGPLNRATQVIQAATGKPAGGTPPDEGTPLLSRDSTKLVIQVWPAQPSYAGLDYCRRVTELLQGIIAQADLLQLGVQARLTGAYVAVTESNEIIRKDMNFVTLVSSLGVLLLLALTFSSAFLTLVALVPLLVSALFTMAWAKFSAGGFNLITTFLPSLVLGLGIDFSIHLLSRYVEEREAGRSVGRALYTAIHKKGEASLSAALTTAAVFVCLLVSRSRALTEMGLIMSLGIVLAYLSAMLLTPSLIVLSYVAFKRRFREHMPVPTQALARGYKGLLSQRRAVVGLTLLLTLALSYQVSQVEFRFVSGQLAPQTQASQVANEILREFQGEVSFSDEFVFFVKDPAQLRKLEGALAESPFVTGIDSIRDILPQELLRGKASLQDLPVGDLLAVVDSLEGVLGRWEELIDALQRLAVQLAGWELSSLLAGDVALATSLSHRSSALLRLAYELEELDRDSSLRLLAGIKGDLQNVSAFLENLASLPDEPELIRALVEVLPEQLKPVYYSPTSQEFILRARVSPSLYEGHNLQEFVDWVQGLGVDYFGVPEVQGRLEAYMKRDFAFSTAIASFLIALLVWMSFGSLREALLAVSPLAIGYLWMLAGMRLLGISFNFTNIVISPLLIGIGVDSAIHILHRIKEERGRRRMAIAWGMAATLPPVLSTSLTTMLVFGALVFARTPGLRYLGISALLGLGFTLLASLVFLPAAAARLDEPRRGD